MKTRIQDSFENMMLTIPKVMVLGVAVGIIVFMLT